jgi:hypothetical protein
MLWAVRLVGTSGRKYDPVGRQSGRYEALDRGVRVAWAINLVVGCVALFTFVVLLARSGITVKRLEDWFDKKSPGVQLAVGGFAAVVLWLVWATLLIRVVAWAWTGDWLPLPLADSKDMETLGQIGDLFGGVNALFAAFAFVGVAVAAHYQYKTFALQREQNVRQSFEPLFFKLLEERDHPPTLVPEFMASKSHVVPKHFAECVVELREHLVAIADGVQRRGSNLDWSLFAEPYENFYGENESDLGPYFRKLFHIFKLIARSDLRWEEKVQYANIARASLDTNELTLLVLNCGTTRGADFKTYVEGFGLLKHMRSVPRQDLGVRTIERVIAEAIYKPTATMDAAGREEHWRKNGGERPHWAADGRR